MALLSIHAFGVPTIEVRGQAITVDTRKAVGLFIFLAVERRAHSRDSLSALLWPEYDQTHARATLRRTLSALIHALPPAILTINRDTIALADDANLSIDVESFRRYLRQSTEHGHSETEVCAACLPSLRQAVDLYAADFLAGFHLRDSESFEDWQVAQCDALRRELASALERLTRQLTVQHAFVEALSYARRLLDLDPLHETAHRYLMRLYDWSGQYAAALRQYRSCVQILDQELGIAPLDITTRLYEAIREHRAPAPPARVATAPFNPALLETSSFNTEAGGDTANAPLPTSAALLPATLPAPFVGRAAEWQEALLAYQRAESGGYILAVEGEAGIGKTRFVERLLLNARMKGATSIRARCYEGEETLAYAPIAAVLRAALAQDDQRARLMDLPDHWLSEIARLTPEITTLRVGLPVAPALDNPGAQSRFFEGMRQALIGVLCGASQPGLLFLDDLHWADAASLALVAYLTRRISDVPFCLAVAWRGADLSPEHPLRQWLVEVQRAGCVTSLHLGRLPESAVKDWVAASLSGDSARPLREIAARVYQETEGLPFFVSEYVLALASGALGSHDQLWSVPGGVRDLLRSRLRLLTEEARQVLTAAAVLGHSFDFAIVRESSGRSEEEAVAALETLTQHGLLAEVAGPRVEGPTYDFTHQKLRELTYEDASLARRRLLHRRAAEALVSLGHRQRAEGLAAGQIAQHFLAAGDELAAADYFRLAAERARSLYANEDALRDFQRSLALGHPDVATLHEASGDMYVLLGLYGEALASFENAAARCDDVSLARLEQKLSKVYARRGNWDAAQSHLESALALLSDVEEPTLRAHIFAEWSMIARHRGDKEASQTLALRAQAEAIAGDDPRALAEAHNVLGVLASDRNDHAAGILHLEQSLALAERAMDTNARAAALTNLALALGRTGEGTQALRLAEEALALCAAQGDRHHQAALHNNIADLLHAAGRADDAMQHLKSAVTILAEIGVESGAVQPEIWKLAEW